MSNNKPTFWVDQYNQRHYIFRNAVHHKDRLFPADAARLGTKTEQELLRPEIHFNLNWISTQILAQMDVGLFEYITPQLIISEDLKDALVSIMTNKGYDVSVATSTTQDSLTQYQITINWEP